MLTTYRALRRKGVMGINERNIRYINEGNPRRLMRLVNDKLETKRLAQNANIACPDLYGVIGNTLDMRKLPEMMDHADGFVIKPAQGSQGNGILVIESQLKNGWRLANGRRIMLDAIKFQIYNILSGMYSLGGQPDKAMIEYRVKFDDVFGKVSFKGVPDIRVIVLYGVPVFSMVRLPTAESDGKANLHKGGVGVGINMATGLSQHAMQHDQFVDVHPDTAHPLKNIQAPYWDEILMMSARAYDVTKLGYLGVDIVLDKDRGPLLLELNARPGISIQIANRMGMRFALARAASATSDKMTARERVAIAKTLQAGPSVKRATSAA